MYEAHASTGAAAAASGSADVDKGKCHKKRCIIN